MVRSVKLLIEQNSTRDALTAMTKAIEYDPSLVESRILITLLLLDRRDVPAALKHAREAVRLMPNQPDAVELTRICTTAARIGSDNLPGAQLAAICTRHDIPTLASRFANTADSQIQNFRAKLDRAWPGAGALLTETKGGALTLNLSGRANISEISRLRGIPLRQLSLRGTSVTNFMPLQNMPLISLDLAGTPATQLGIPPNLPLEHLICGAEDASSSSPLADISLLKGLRLGRLDMNPCKVTNISSLAGMPITNLHIHAPVTDLAPLRGMPVAELTLIGGAATSLEPLRGMPLTHLTLSQMPLPDISALRGLKLKELRLDGTRTADLSPLQGMPLTRLDLANLPVSDLTPLEGMPLQSLSFSGCSDFADISPIGKLPLTALEFNQCQGLRDLRPIRRLSLQCLRLVSCPGVANLSPLQDMKTLTTLDTDVPGPVHELSTALTLGIQAAADKARSMEAYRNVPALAEAAATVHLVMEKLLPLLSSTNSTPRTIPPEAVPFGGHHYWIIAPNFQCTWSEAVIIAKNLGGHLASITTQEEMDWMKSGILAKSTTPRWLGGTDRANPGTWLWITGEDWTLKNWAPGQPDNADGAEHCMATRPDGCWISTGDQARHGILIEWDR
jgi:Leucine-rich repeat (LRR) protein